MMFSRKSLAACGLALCLSTALAVSASFPACAMVGDLVNGQYVYNNGSVIEGVLEKGISVSKYQNRAGQIDWNAVRADGISFVFVRYGYLRDQDPYFQENITNAAAAGLKTGAYIYSQATNPFIAAQEAYDMIQQLKDYPISYPIAYDVESQTILDAGLTPQQLSEQINIFCRIVSDAGYIPIIYGNNEWFTNYIDSSLIPYDIWYARYGTDQHAYPNRTVWQCSDSGQVNGITGNVTLELAFKDYSSLIPADTWRQINGKWYYFRNYQKQTGWIELDQKWYYLDPYADGAMLSDTTRSINGTLYTFDHSGVMQ